MQFFDPVRAAWPTLYFAEESGVGLAMRALPAGHRRIGVAGLGIGTLAFFILLYMAASKLVPLVPVWEVQEGQLAHSLRKVGKETVISVADME
jgi:hypothetical protein